MHGPIKLLRVSKLYHLIILSYSPDALQPGDYGYKVGSDSPGAIRSFARRTASLNISSSSTRLTPSALTVEKQKRSRLCKYSELDDPQHQVEAKDPQEILSD